MGELQSPLRTRRLHWRRRGLPHKPLLQQFSQHVLREERALGRVQGTRLPNDWSCNILSCTDPGQNCMSSRCCNNPGEHCFKKDEHWAMCNTTCSQNMLWVHDEWV